MKVYAVFGESVVESYDYDRYDELELLSICANEEDAWRRVTELKDKEMHTHDMTNVPVIKKEWTGMYGRCKGWRIGYDDSWYGYYYQERELEGLVREALSSEMKGANLIFMTYFLRTQTRKPSQRKCARKRNERSGCE